MAGGQCNLPFVYAQWAGSLLRERERKGEQYYCVLSICCCCCVRSQTQQFVELSCFAFFTCDRPAEWLEALKLREHSAALLLRLLLPSLLLRLTLLPQRNALLSSLLYLAHSRSTLHLHSFLFRRSSGATQRYCLSVLFPLLCWLSRSAAQLWLSRSAPSYVCVCRAQVAIDFNCMLAALRCLPAHSGCKTYFAANNAFH